MALIDSYIHARLERTWRFGVTPSQVKRSLFGPVDHDANAHFLKEEMEKLRQEDSKKWNFDFVNGVPLAVTGKGDQEYEWTPVRTRDAAPKMREAEDRNDVNKNGGDELTSKEISPKDVGPQIPTRQTQITDFMRKRKSSFPGRKNGSTSSTEPSIKTSRRSSA